MGSLIEEIRWNFKFGVNNNTTNLEQILRLDAFYVNVERYENEISFSNYYFMNDTLIPIKLPNTCNFSIFVRIGIPFKIILTIRSSCLILRISEITRALTHTKTKFKL